MGQDLLSVVATSSDRGHQAQGILGVNGTSASWPEAG